MNSPQYSAAERNHYFYGKLMTARDFEDEQTYFNNKRRLSNRLLHGAGIVSGLGVLPVDNQTFSLEAGMALDYLGREIVVREPCVKRLSVIRGYDQIKESGDVYLGIAYSEELAESTFSVTGMGAESGVTRAYNRVEEGYELFLTTRAPDPSSLGVERVLYDRVRVFEGEGVSIVLQLPKYANTDEPYRMRVLFEKRDVSAPVSFAFSVESDLFRGENGESSVKVEYDETEVTTYKELALEYTMTCGPVRHDFTDIRIPARSFSLRLGKRGAQGMEKDLERHVEIAARPLRELAAEAWRARGFDELLTPTGDQEIYLAKLHIIAGQSAFFIEHITRDPFRQHLPSVQLLDMLLGLERETERGGQKVAPGAGAAVTGAPAPRPRRVAAGVENVPLGASPKVGHSYFSHEFIHGLGAGNVCVVVAAEYSEGFGGVDALVFGEGIFNRESSSIAPPACSTAALVNVKKGTLQLGLKLLEKTALQSIRLRWWAWMADEEEPEKEEMASEVRVTISPDTANLEPLQQIRFTAAVEGSVSQEVNWSVVEKNGGGIDRNGLYTAPATEGVFEIQAQSVKYGACRASAYVVVGSI